MPVILSQKSDYPIIKDELDCVLIEEFEKKYDENISFIAHEALRQNKNIILLTGPSASGKTTTAHKIAHEITKAFDSNFKDGYEHCKIVSLDNFFLSAKDAPKLANGEQDFESVHALDIKRINEFLNGLLNKHKAMIPKFDFKKGLMIPDAKEIDVGENGFVILEGIHAHNPLIYGKVPGEKVLKVYISAHSGFYDGDVEVLTRKDVRLLRRSIRDNKYRGSSLENTMKMWDNVLLAESEYVAPYRKTADIVLDTTAPYEINIYYEQAIKLFSSIDKQSRFYEYTQKVLNAVKLFSNASCIKLPDTSIICEFIGGGRYHL